MLSIDPNILRVARKIAAIQGVRPQNVLVAREIVVAGHDLDRAHTLARKVLRGDDQASEQLVAKIGGSSPLPRGYRSESRAPSPRAAALIGMAQAGPIHGGPCLDHVRGDLELLQAAFRLDVQRHHRDGRLTTRAARFVRERRDRLAEFERELDQPSMDIAETRPRGVRSPRGATPTRGGRPLDRGNVPITDAESGIPRGRQPPPNRTPLLPPDADVPDVGDPFEPGLDLDSCLELGDICVQLFNDFARASLADDDAQLIALVEPNCLCVDDFDDNTIFTARPDPDPNRGFPAQQGDYRLIFRGGDITNRIRPGTWSPKAIEFTIPAQSFTGYVYLRRFINTVSGGLGRTLSNLCGIPDLGVPGGGLSPSPRATISIVRPPVIEAFGVKGHAGNRVVTEACTAVTFAWAVRLEDQALGQLLPPCGAIGITIQDEQGNSLHPSAEAIGEWTTNPAQSMRYRVIAGSLAGQKECGRVQSDWIEVVREHRLYVEPDEPSTPSIVGGKTGTLTVRLSCPAPPQGARVRLVSSDRNILRLPNSVLVFPGERSAPVQFSTSKDHSGNVTITARLANHSDGTLQYSVLDNLTAIVLSGGGAKGSFEVGALLYLREIWNEVRPRIICGTSVGAINALALAEALDARGVDKVERIWLGLQYYGNMYKPSPELRSALDAAAIPFEDFVAVLNEQEGASIDFGLLNLIDESEAAAWAAAGWAIGGPVGAIGAGLASIFGGAEGAVSDVLNAVKNASYLLDLEPTQTKIELEVDPGSIATSGMKLRLAVVALQDGLLYYVTESSRLLRGRAVNASFDEPITSNNPLVVGAMASAAIPGFFQARNITTSTISMHYVDGGVREVLPAQAAVELGAQLIFNISASRFDPEPKWEPYGDPGMMLPIMMRGVDLAVNEVASEEKQPRAGFCDERQRVLIQPSFEIHKTVEIDPGLIRINMAYGYFRAFDADQLRRGKITVLEYVLWYLWTDDLIQERRTCHELEKGPEMQYSRVSGLFYPWILQEIRYHKNRIAELIEGRFEVFGADAFPRKLVDNVIGGQAVLDWYDTWEIHQEPQRSFLNTVNLWNPQITAPGMIFEERGSSPPRESEIHEKYPLPAAVLAGLWLR